jgi:hypothetical protein
LFDIFGFSRGAAAARHFANRVQSKDRAISMQFRQVCKFTYRGTPQAKPAFSASWTPWRRSARWQTVSISADTGNVNIRLRPGVAEKVFHITAQHECRYNFALNSVAPAWPELALPGAHSDIGGGYLPNCGKTSFSPVRRWKPCLKTSWRAIARLPAGDGAWRAGTFPSHHAHYSYQRHHPGRMGG